MTEPQGIGALANPALIAPHVQAVPTSTAKTQNGPRVQLAAYIDVRAVAEILDRVVGPANWSFEKQGPEQADKGWVCHGRLTIFTDGREVVREDIGGGSGDIETGGKGAVSDALKRAAVQFGLGRALYRLDHAWIAGKEDRRGKVQPDKTEVAKVVEGWRKRLLEQGEVPALAASADEAPKDEDPAPVAQDDSAVEYASPQQRAGLKKRAESKGIDLIQMLRDEFGALEIDKIPADKVGPIIDRIAGHTGGDDPDESLKRAQQAQERYQGLLSHEREGMSRSDINKILREQGITEQMDLLDDKKFAACEQAVAQTVLA
jgi:hypothetical protein